MSLLVLILFLERGFSQSFDENEWQTLSCEGEPVARHEAAFIEVKGEFYLVGGRRIQEVSIFNPKTNTWASGAKPPIEMHHFQGVSYKGKIYVVGAHTGKYPHETPLTEAYVYDPVDDTHGKKNSMPKNRVRASTTATVYKNKLYIAGSIIDGYWDGHVPTQRAGCMAVCVKNKIVYLDYYTPMVNENKGLKRNMVERREYNIMEPLVKEAIKKALKKERVIIYNY